MTRATIALITLAALGAAAHADGIIYKRGGRVQLWGFPETVGSGANAVPVTPEIAELYADQSTGLIETEGYDQITGKRSANAKVDTFTMAEIQRVFLSSEPDGIANGNAAMDQGRFLQAVGEFKAVLQDPAAREVFKAFAAYQIGLCYYYAGRKPDAIKHFQAWKPSNSKYTPEVYDTLAKLLTEDREYAKARAQYDEIPKLPSIPDDWKYKARLGGVRVDIAERKYDDAERTAQGIARETQARADLADATALAQVLVADAIWRSGKTERFGEATAALDRTAALEGISINTKGFLYLTQGNLLYAQGKPEDARFPYLKAALMCPDSGAEGPAYLNAGQCLLDMSARETKDMARSDALFVNGMKLLATAAGTYKNPDAAKRYREPANKARFESLQAKGGEPADGGGGAVETDK